MKFPPRSLPLEVVLWSAVFLIGGVWTAARWWVYGDRALALLGAAMLLASVGLTLRYALARWLALVLIALMAAQLAYWITSDRVTRERLLGLLAAIWAAWGVWRLRLNERGRPGDPPPHTPLSGE